MTLWGQQITTQKLLFLKFYFQSLGNRQTPAGRLPQGRNLRENPTRQHPEAFSGLSGRDGTERRTPGSGESPIPT